MIEVSSPAAEKQKTLKVLHVITLSEWGGAQKVVYDLVCGLDRQKFLPEVACAPSGLLVKRLQSQGVRVHEIPSLKRNISPLDDLRALYSLYRLMRKEKYAAVHCHSSKAGLLGRLAARLAKVDRIYFTVHGWGFYNRKEFGRMNSVMVGLERWAGRFTSRLICVSQDTLKEGLARNIAPAGKFTVVYNGLAPGENAQGTGKLRAVAGAGEEDRVVVMVARLAYPKEPLLFLSAAKEVLAVYPRARFVLIGDGPLMEECRAFQESESLTGHVFLPGFCPDVASLIEDADIFVLLSSFEGLPLTVIEAMRAKLPVVASRVGGLGELVADGETGFLVDHLDVRQLVDKLLFLLENPLLGREMGESGYRHFNEKFSLTRMVRDYEKLYETGTL